MIQHHNFLHVCARLQAIHELVSYLNGMATFVAIWTVCSFRTPKHQNTVALLYLLRH